MATGGVLVAAGGTGGHLFPAEALAAALAKHNVPVGLLTDARAARHAGAFPPDAVHIIPSATIRGQNSPGTDPRSTPKKSRSCVLAMSTAIPFVKPITTGRGMNLTADPIPVRPMTTSMTPAIIVHMNRPSTPYLATMPATTTTNAPVGPAICTREPPSADTRKPVTTAQ